MKRYSFARWRDLILVRAALQGELGVAVARLMVDTGSAQSMLSWQKLQEAGYNPAASAERRYVSTVGSMIAVPQVRLRRFHCLGKVVENFPVLCHTVPFGIRVNGLLGMDFLRAFDIAIYPQRGYIEVE